MSPKVDFIEDNNGDPIPPKIQGVRVIVDATKLNGILFQVIITFTILIILMT